MRHYECECLKCGRNAQIAFQTEPYPEIGEFFPQFCPSCSEETQTTRVLTKKAAAGLRRRQEEADLRQIILDHSAEYGFQCRFLYHESTTKINFLRIWHYL